ncbi:MAG TPA: alpha/beta hydrolase [Acidimicrobiales bacterium]|nr:alpha/beta hydrolase [Acidimicrobiales bacterium]
MTAGLADTDRPMTGLFPPTAPLLVIPDVTDPGAGRHWETALRSAGWAGPVMVADLPGHGRAAPPADGNYEMAEVIAALRALHGAGDDPAVVLGEKGSGWTAQVMALAGRTCGLVLVDGLGGPWLAPAEVIAGWRRWLRDLADDQDALGPAPPAGPDPRLAHRRPTQNSREQAERAAALVKVPTLVIETPASALTPSEAAELAGQFGLGVLRRVASRAEASAVLVGLAAEPTPPA